LPAVLEELALRPVRRQRHGRSVAAWRGRRTLLRGGWLESPQSNLLLDRSVYHSCSCPGRNGL